MIDTNSISRADKLFCSRSVTWGPKGLSMPVFLAFHHYLAKNFHLHILCWELYYCPICYLKWCIITFCFKYFLSYSCFCILWVFMLHKKPQYFTIPVRENLSHKAIWLKFRPSSFTKFLRNLIMISIFLCVKKWCFNN